MDFAVPFVAVMGRLREIREKEGLSRAELARLAHLSDKTLLRAESGGQISKPSQNAIVNALNRRDERLREYTVGRVFSSKTAKGTQGARA